MILSPFFASMERPATLPGVFFMRKTGAKMNIQKRKRKSGTAFIIQFTLGARRRALYLPKGYNERQAQRVLNAVQETLDAIETGRAVDSATWLYLNNLTPDLRARFIRAGLIETPQIKTIKDVCNEFLSEISQTHKAATVNLRIWTIDKLSRYIDLNNPIETIDAPLLDKIRGEMRGVSENTFEIFARGLKVLLNWAVKKNYLQRSPLNDYKIGRTLNKAREYFIDRATAEKILAPAPPVERVLFTLYRFGGLRKMEAPLVTFADVDFKAGRVRITSPKTENKGKAVRYIPLFPELRREIETINGDNDAPLVGAIDTAGKIDWTIKRMLKRANVENWPRIIQNLRSSRAIEIEREFGAIVEAEWLGHLPKTAADHYLHATPADFKRAISGN